MTAKNPFQANINNLEDVADLLSQLLHRPVTIEDANHKLLSYSTHHGITDQARTTTIIERRVPERVINQLWKEGAIPSLLSSKKPVYIKAIDNVGLGNRLAISIWHNEEVLGFIWALELSRPFDKHDYQLLIQAEKAAKNIFMKNRLTVKQEEEDYQEFFWKLLTSHFKSNEIIVQKFNELQLVAPSYYSIAIFQYKQEITEDIENKIDYLLNTFQRPKVLLYTIDKQNLICLSSMDENDSLETLSNFSDKFISKMEKRFSIKSIIQGISEIQDDLSKIEHSYHEALTVLSMKEKFSSEVSHIHSYQELGFYRYLDVLLESNKRNKYRNTALARLFEYDQKYQNNLVETLEIYLNKDCNVHCAAKALNIHPNTLSYRIKRISEISGINLKNVDQKITLFLDLKLKKYS